MQSLAAPSDRDPKKNTAKLAVIVPSRHSHKHANPHTWNTLGTHNVINSDKNKREKNLNKISLLKSYQGVVKSCSIPDVTANNTSTSRDLFSVLHKTWSQRSCVEHLGSLNKADSRTAESIS